MTSDTNVFLKRTDYAVIGCLFLAGLVLLFRDNILATYGEQQFRLLAQSFLHGHLYFVEMPENVGDTAFADGHYYWPLGPMPALLLLPFVALFGAAVSQGYLLLAINLANLYLLYRISAGITRNIGTALWLTFAYVFSTAYVHIALKPWSWYFAQAVATLFVLLCLHEFFSRRRAWLIGIYLALAVSTRANLLLVAGFFAAFVLLDAAISQRQRVLFLVKMGLPIAVGLSFLMAYNYHRFGSPFEFGYRYQLLENEPATNIQHGLWSFVHFPANLYYFLFRGPDAVFLPDSKVLTYPYVLADIWGMSILFTSPILLWGMRAPMKERVVYLSLATSLVMLFVILGYYGIGVRQYGYRYALDFYPFLFVMLAFAARERFTAVMRGVIVASCLLNFYMIQF